jgi:uncharacterized protein
MNTVLALLFGTGVGLSLGLTGGGGSILAVPLLVYGLGFDLRAAVAVSLAVVGLTSLFGAVLQARSGLVLWRAGIVLGAGGIVAAPLGAWIGARMPDDLVLVLFALLMVFVGLRMVGGGAAREVPVGRFSCPRDDRGMPRTSIACIGKLAVAGALTGVLSGIFGVGGGFLLVPALLWVGSARIDYALATSLVAIALISVSGFIANMNATGAVSVLTVVVFAAGAAAGMAVGAVWKRRLSPRVLGRVFAAVAIGAGIYVVLQVVL